MSNPKEYIRGVLLMAIFCCEEFVVGSNDLDFEFTVTSVDGDSFTIEYQYKNGYNTFYEDIDGSGKRDYPVHEDIIEKGIEFFESYKHIPNIYKQVENLLENLTK